MQLVMFDIDGTLTDTHDTDANGFVDAVREELNITGIDTNWAGYPQATSEGVLDEIVRRATGHAVTVDESRAVQRRLAAKLRPGFIREIPGAGAFVRRLTEAGFAVALASGDWELTARLKLAGAGIPADGLPAAFCDSSSDRTEIMRLSLRLSLGRHRREKFDRVVYFGDGSWDARACRQLCWPFVGVETDESDRLRTHGADQVIKDYCDIDAVLGAITSATVPR